MKRLIGLAVATFLLSMGSAHAEIYRWKDAQGNLHVSDTPPPGVKNVTSRPLSSVQRSTSSASATAAPKSLAEQDQEFRKRRQEAADKAEKDAKEAQQAQQAKENCAQAKAQLRSLEDGVRMGTVDAQGNRVIMDDAARAKATERTRQSVKDWCK